MYECISHRMLIGWSISGVIMLGHYLTGKSGSQGSEPVALWQMLFLLMGEVIAGWVLLSSLFGKQSFRIESAHLTMETAVLGFRRRATIAKDSIKRIVQIKGGGDGDDSFPSWA